VAPAELEAVLVSHPKIGDAAVTSVPHERQGEAPKAFIVRKEEGLTEKEVMEFMASKVRGGRERERGDVQWQHNTIIL
jgi:acyl-CoA synthetase (AMP-forming)/AMP-acid ligase II